MELQRLKPLAILLLLLVVLGVWKNMRPTRRRISEEAGLQRLSPADFLVADVGRVTVTLPGATAPAVALQRLNEKDWSVTSLYDVPADTMKVEGLVEKLKNLQGELRSSKREIMADFALDAAQAWQLRCYKKDQSDTASFELLVGKKAGSSATFVRLPADDIVYSVGVDFRNEMGVWGDDQKKAPEGKHFMAKRFLTVDGPKATRLALTAPGKRVVVERREKARAESQTSDETTTAPASPAPPEYEWHLVEGPRDLEFKADAVKEIIRDLDSLEATDAMDPTTPALWGMDGPDFLAELSLESGEPVVIEGHRTSADGYLRVKGQKPIFKVGTWNFDKIFPKGTKLFTLPKLSIKADDLTRIAVTKQGSTLVTERKDVGGTKKWVLVEPLVVEADETKLSDLGWGVGGLNVDDYADAGALPKLGLQPPQGTIVCTLSSGETKTIEVGALTPGDGGRYVRMVGQPGVLVVGKYNIDRAYVGLDDIKKQPPAASEGTPGDSDPDAGYTSGGDMGDEYHGDDE